MQLGAGMGGGVELTQCREKTRRDDEECFFLSVFKKKKRRLLLHFAVTSSVTAPVEEGGGEVYAGGVGEGGVGGALSLYSSLILSVTLSSVCPTVPCSHEDYCICRPAQEFPPTLIF